jgi:hypothetical protein
MRWSGSRRRILPLAGKHGHGSTSPQRYVPQDHAPTERGAILRARDRLAHDGGKSPKKRRSGRRPALAHGEDLDDDTGGLNARGQPNHTRIWIYDPQSGSWDRVAWELAALPTDPSWVGLLAITRSPDGDYVLIERDNRTGDFAELKTLVKVSVAAITGGVSAAHKSVYDLLPAPQETNGLITDKPDGTVITDAGRPFVVTDNDGADDSPSCRDPKTGSSGRASSTRQPFIIGTRTGVYPSDTHRPHHRRRHRRANPGDPPSRPGAGPA